MRGMELGHRAKVQPSPTHKHIQTEYLKNKKSVTIKHHTVLLFFGFYHPPTSSAWGRYRWGAWRYQLQEMTGIRLDRDYSRRSSKHVLFLVKIVVYISNAIDFSTVWVELNKDSSLRLLDHRSACCQYDQKTSMPKYKVFNNLTTFSECTATRSNYTRWPGLLIVQVG